jgi:hypothetical protein
VKTTLAALAIILLITSTALAHAGHAHTYMGVVEALHDDQSFTVKTTDGKSVTVKTATTTTYARADGTAATRADLALGMRVVVKMAADGKTAASVKMA